MAKGKSKTSAKQRIDCFQASLPTFLMEQQNYLANRKEGKRTKK